MSLEAMHWALRVSGPTNAVERLVLMELGNRALPDTGRVVVDDDMVAALMVLTSERRGLVLDALSQLEWAALIVPSDGDCEYVVGPVRAARRARRPAYRKRPVPAALRREVFERDGWLCLRCGADDPSVLRADHVVPERLGGEMTVENMQTLCGPCNSWKQLKVVDFR